MTPEAFRRRYLWLMIFTWNLPALVGFAFILLIGVLTPSQVLGILSTPLEPAYIILWQIIGIGLLPYQMKPLTDWLARKPGSSPEAVLRAVRRFPLWYWGLFLLYLVVAAISVVVAADIYTDFEATPLALFRIELVALIVSIIVGLPIFFLILDLLGRAMGGLMTMRPIITIKTKVFLIGALIPLLIDTMLVQYYWTRTGFFTSETFIIWLALELLAIGGSLIFVRSFGQSLSPLQGVIAQAVPLWKQEPDTIRACSTDELGVLAGGFRNLLNDLLIHNEILGQNNHFLRSAEAESQLPELLDAIVALVDRAIDGDMAFLILKDTERDELVGVAQTGDTYSAEGYFHLQLDEVSLAVEVFNTRTTLAIDDVHSDPRVSPRLRERFGVCSALAAPLLMEGEPLGVLMSISREQPQHYSAREILLLESLAHEAALAIHTVRLRQQHQILKQRQWAQHQALLELSRAQAAAEEDLRTALKVSTETVARTLGVARASVWHYREKHDAIECLDLYNSEKGEHESGIELSARDYPAYFRALEENRVIVARDAHMAPETTEFSESYLQPLGIGAMLDAPLRRGTKVVGVMCIEHVGGPRDWNIDEQNFAASVADMISLVLELWEHKRTADSLRRHQDHLEELVAERTAQLQATNEELEAFSYSVSHDLRSPLRAIDGFSKALLEDYQDRLDDTARDYLQRVCRGAERMGHLIDDLLQLSRVSRTALEKRSVDLRQLAGEITGKLCEREPERQVQIVLGESLTARGDERLLSIVLENLFENAWKFTRYVAAPHIEFGMVKEGDETVFFVRDNGAGFDMTYADKLFGAFQRLHSAQDFEGTGIGLATVQRIVHRHGGRVWAEAVPGEGATFYFTLSAAD